MDTDASYHMTFNKQVVSEPGFDLSMWVDTKQNSMLRSESLACGASLKAWCPNAIKDKEILI